MSPLQSNNYIENFPSDATPRPQQVEALEKIHEIFSKGKKFAIACLPTGSGKSHIATAIARSSTPIDDYRKGLIETYAIYKRTEGGYLHEDDFLHGSFGSYILTITKSLQDQYSALFPESVMAKGKSNYPCDVDPNVSVEAAPCLYTNGMREKCFHADRCEYYKARNKAFKANDSILNYRAFISLPEFLRKREVYICDEAGDLEDELVGQFSITITYAQLAAENIDFKKLGTDDPVEALRWISEIYIKMERLASELKERINSSSKDPSYAAIKNREAQKLGKMTNLVNSMKDVITMWSDCQYLVEVRDTEKVVLVPYDIKPFAERLFQGADMVVLMSATITNKEEFTKSLGIPEDQYEFFEIPSTFPPEKSPIYVDRRNSLSFKTLKQTLPKVLDVVLEICERHKGEKGLIHTHTNAITEALKSHVYRSGMGHRFLFREEGISNEYIIEQHEESEEDTILVSPSLDTGISLDDDLGRFQIIVKAPFLPLGSKRVKKIFDTNKKYYGMKMLDTLVQMCGRCTRSKDDYSSTYIVDANAFNQIQMNKKNLPKHFLERFH